MNTRGDNEPTAPELVIGLVCATDVAPTHDLLQNDQ